MIISDKKFENIMNTFDRDVFINNREEMLKNRDCIMEIMSIYYLYSYVFPLFIHNEIHNIDDKYDQNNHIVIDPVGDSKYFKERIEFDILESHQINIDTSMQLCKLIKNNNIKSIINCGTGCGSSLAYVDFASSGLGYKINVVSYDHLPIFNKITKYLLNKLVEFKICPNNLMIDFYDSSVIDFSQHSSYNKYKRFICSEDFVVTTFNKHTKLPLLTYDSVPDDKKYDLLILDGPSFFRFPTLLSMIDRVSEDGLVIFEGCRKEVPILKYIGVPIVSETGTPQRKDHKILGVGYKVFSTTIVKASEIRKRLERY